MPGASGFTEVPDALKKIVDERGAHDDLPSNCNLCRASAQAGFMAHTDFGRFSLQ